MEQVRCSAGEVVVPVRVSTRARLLCRVSVFKLLFTEASPTSVFNASPTSVLEYLGWTAAQYMQVVAETNNVCLQIHTLVEFSL